MGPTFVRSGRYTMLVDVAPERVLEGSAVSGARGARRGKTGRLYDLVVDPSEQSDLWNHEPGVVGELLEVYRRRLSEPFREFAASRKDRPAQFSFAISARHLNPSAADPSVGWETSGWR